MLCCGLRQGNPVSHAYNIRITGLSPDYFIPYKSPDHKTGNACLSSGMSYFFKDKPLLFRTINIHTRKNKMEMQYKGIISCSAGRA
jgi:hypothetical protein